MSDQDWIKKRFTYKTHFLETYKTSNNREYLFKMFSFYFLISGCLVNNKKISVVHKLWNFRINCIFSERGGEPPPPPTWNTKCCKCVNQVRKRSSVLNSQILFLLYVKCLLVFISVKRLRRYEVHSCMKQYWLEVKYKIFTQS